MSKQIGNEYVSWLPNRKDQNTIEKCVKDKKSFIILGDSDCVKGVLSEVAEKYGYTYKTTGNIAASTLADDGGVSIPSRYDPTGEWKGKTLIPDWAAEIVDSPKTQYLLCIDYIDYSNMKSFEWLKSVLNHSICGKKVDNYIVCAHALTGNPSQMDYEKLCSHFDVVIN